MESKSLCYISVPSLFVGLSFGDLFNDLLMKHEILAIGIFRDDISDELENTLPFVYTNPLSSLLLKSTDLVYVLASENGIP